MISRFCFHNSHAAASISAERSPMPFIVGVLLLILLWYSLKEFGKAVGTLVGLVLGLVMIALIAGVLWKLAVFVFPYLLGAGAIVAVALLLVKSLRSANAPPLSHVALFAQ
jgi:uncharacterized membrane protein